MQSFPHRETSLAASPTVHPVSLIGFFPSASITKILNPLPIRVETNAIFVPSGDQSGSKSYVGWFVSLT